MMKKMIKIIMILTMLLGIVFSISNFIIPGEIKASSDMGTWVINGDESTCEGHGSDCDILIE